ncbi:DNA double-strand break repair nuclease NurA [Candidatus Bathyarchaeota archaeon]|nr:DNA double-strand break repair nuclease NurA [Candidatus Bathyarchaeota archaeon]
MAEASEELPEWVKLPLDLQHEFFRLAEEEARELIKVIRRIDESLKELKNELTAHIRIFPKQTKKSIIAAVDSSRSPRFSERLGVRYGVFATGIVYLKGTEKRKERLKPGIFKRKQALSRDESRYFFSLLTTHYERKMALEALKECDILFIDGSFYGFLYPALDMKKLGLLELEDKKRIFRETFEITEELRKSGKVLGVIKRSHTRALGGYRALKFGDNTLVNVIDKHILSLIMPERSFFEYESLLGDLPPIIYTGIARLASKLASQEKSGENLMKKAKERVYKPFEELNIPRDGFISMRRAQVRFYGDLPPCELEYPSTVNLEDILSESELFSEATNLPLALDLVDSLVGISSKFTEEFVSEIEGRVLEAIVKNGGNLNSIRTFFAFLNPQKPF